MGMRYKLKDGIAPFRPVSGECALHIFKHGEEYEKIPREHAHCFDRIDAPAEEAAAPDAPAEDPARGFRRRKPAAEPAVAGGE